MNPLLIFLELYLYHRLINNAFRIQGAAETMAESQKGL